MQEQRTLRFSSLAEVMPEVDRLLEGYTTVGQWSFGQICNHLTSAIVGSIEGFPGRAPFLIRKTIGPIVKRQILRTGKMRAGVKLPKQFLPAADLDDRAEAEALRGALRVYSGHAGPLAEHPLFGPLGAEEWTRLHCIHSAHHLGFVRPKA